jgi:hypothetical protein
MWSLHCVIDLITNKDGLPPYLEEHKATPTETDAVPPVKHGRMS